MAASGKPQILVPLDARRALGTEEFALSLAKVGRLQQNARVLDLGAGGASWALVRKYGYLVVCADVDERRLETFRALGKSEKADRADVRKLPEGGPWPFAEQEFDAAVCVDRVLLPLEPMLKRVRPHLKQNGHVALLYPVAVGRKPPPPEWEKVFGFPMLLPYQCLAVMERCGFEPASGETLSDPQLSQYYDAVEENLRRFPDQNAAQEAQWRAELEAHAAQKGDVRVTWGCFIGRRKEPGERPPAARDRG